MGIAAMIGVVVIFVPHESASDSVEAGCAGNSSIAVAVVAMVLSGR